MIRKLVLAAAAVAAFTCPASAHKNFPPFVNLLLKADLANEPDRQTWRKQVDDAHEAGLVYIDWHLLNFTQSELFKDLAPPNGGDDEACDALQRKSGKLALSGRTTMDDNHQLARMTFDLDRLPAFTLVTCEQVIGAGASGLRIRGFFYAADHKIETATETGFTPLAVEPSRLPARFFTH
jgi:hypothetical protein